MFTLELDLDVYQGPFDLLLSLILKEEVDLFEIPLAEIIDTYLKGRERAGAWTDWEDVTEFMLVFSLLAELKSRLLLPSGEVEAEEELSPEQMQEQLLARFLEYSKFKAASVYLRGRAMEAARSVLRPPSQQPQRRLPPLEEIVGTGDLLGLRDAMTRLLERNRTPDTSHIADIKVDLRKQMQIIRRILLRRGRFSFDRVFGGERPLVQAMSIFALLELVAKGEVVVSQDKPFGDILVRARKVPSPA
ncbi:MAG: segregation/condensation protein A [Thermoleophilia bacterium]|nr:segregation/condensation protein A [Thermoleophilia bacterium]